MASPADTVRKYVEGIGRSNIDSNEKLKQAAHEIGSMENRA